MPDRTDLDTLKQRYEKAEELVSRERLLQLEEASYEDLDDRIGARHFIREHEQSAGRWFLENWQAFALPVLLADAREVETLREALRKIERIAGAAGYGETPAKPLAEIARDALEGAKP